MVKHRFRPQRSLNFPPGIISAAITNRNTVIAVWTPFVVVSRSRLMSLIITFMFDPAKLQMNCASASGSSSLRAETAGLGVSALGTDIDCSGMEPPQRGRGHGAEDTGAGHTRLI